MVSDHFVGKVVTNFVCGECLGAGFETIRNTRENL